MSICEGGCVCRSVFLWRAEEVMHGSYSEWSVIWWNVSVSRPALPQTEYVAMRTQIHYIRVLICLEIKCRYMHPNSFDTNLNTPQVQYITVHV